MKKLYFSIVCILLPCFALCQEASKIRIRLIYDEPVSDYSVSGWFYPFDAESETGQVELHFVPVDGGNELVFSNVGKHEEGHPDWLLKCTGKNIYDRLFQNSQVVPFTNGETLHCTYHSENTMFKESPLFYDAEFQFYDVDFDGQSELLINYYEQARYGNTYTVYEITPLEFEKKKGKPFDSISNLTEFYPETRKIIDFLYDDTETKSEYSISKDGNNVNSMIILN